MDGHNLDRVHPNHQNENQPRPDNDNGNGDEVNAFEAEDNNNAVVEGHLQGPEEVKEDHGH